MIDLLIGEIRESALKQAFERMRVLEEEDIDHLLNLLKKKKLYSCMSEIWSSVQATDVTLASKDIELTMAYGIFDSFKQDILTKTSRNFEEFTTPKTLVLAVITCINSVSL